MNNRYDSGNDNNPENRGDQQVSGAQWLNNYLENRPEHIKDIGRAIADESPMEFTSDYYQSKLREEKEKAIAREIQEKRERKSRIFCIVFLCFLIIIAVLPPVIRLTSSGESFFNIIVGIIFLYGRLIISWYALGVIIVLLLIVSFYFYRFVVYKVFEDDSVGDDSFMGTTLIGLTAAYIIIIVYYFLTTWNIVPAFLNSVLGFIFPIL